MQIIVIAVIVLAVAVGLIYFMGKKQKALTKNPPSQGGQSSVPQQPKSSTPPSQPQNPATQTPPQNPQV